MTIMTDENMKQLFELISIDIRTLGGIVQSSNKRLGIISDNLDSIDSTLGAINKALEKMANKE